ncbi:MAG: AraC family transcriptional regulator [Bacteroidota bacterium]|nr:AraC family transcriptional regulator [Bacteroidota bacterium]
MNLKDNEYKKRINAVIDYIELNYGEDLTLDKLADIANFSKFHFHRIFAAIVGETLFNFIQRIRLEKAAGQICQSVDKQIIEIAFDCGFSSPSTFSRAFRDFFGISPSELKSRDFENNSKNSKLISNLSKAKSNIEKVWEISPCYFSSVKDVQLLTWRCRMNTNNVTVEVKETESMEVAYIRHIGKYQGDGKLFEMLFGRLFNWAGPRGLIRFPEIKLMSVYYDNPDITEDDKLRVDVCLTVPGNTKADGEVGRMTIPGGKYAIGTFEISDTEYGEAWEFMVGGWLPKSGFQPDERPCFELYLNDPKQHPEGKHLVAIHFPVKPM